MIEQIREVIAASDMVLLGIGDELSLQKVSKEKLLEAYHTMAQLVAGKPWFAVTLNTDDVIFESELNRFFIVAPCGSDASGNVVTNVDYDESEYLPQWQFYQNWLASTIGKKLCMLEFGVGMKYPSVVRMPFEKMAYLNQKAFLVRVHTKLAMVPENAMGRSLCISENALDILEKLKNN
ncbi:MAG: hypothetical protein Q4B57_04050 [Eubacteriales bacterium]|nr:hypothetical protein [Eubacteriales bacterium]